jgi:formylglycine-generating enzyme required for sulfatase activity
VRDFFIGIVPVTQAFWHHITATDSPAVHRAADLPVENVSWDALTQPGGFLQQVNESAAAASLCEQVGRPLVLRLPTETEWEYAARGGPHWRDRYEYSGSNDIGAVAWYDRRHGDWTQPVAGKAPNQLGIYDMSGNIWEWCADTFTRELSAIPVDGTVYDGPGEERVLRGGCFHNWAVHCTVSNRYEIAHDFHDGCIGLRLAMAETRAAARGGA